MGFGNRPGPILELLQENLFGPIGLSLELLLPAITVGGSFWSVGIICLPPGTRNKTVILKLA